MMYYHWLYLFTTFWAGCVIGFITASVFAIGKDSDKAKGEVPHV